MQMIFSILRAAHCRSTHHYFAIDALKRLPTASAQRLGKLLLKYHDEYLDGAKAPDARFKDFQNHVIHVSDNNWGGAVEKCQEWLGVALKQLNEGRWKKAAYACGVLSHYFTDPIMPFHTAQSPDETSVHRPVEWSVFKAYDEIYQLSQRQQSAAQFQFADDANWIGKAVLAMAQVSHHHYQSLIENYQLTAATSQPHFGLNETSRNTFASLFTLAIDGWSAVLTRLADETHTDLPLVSLHVPTILAAVDMPLAWLVRRISNASERRAVAAAIREFERTGTVTRHVAEETKYILKAKATQASPVTIAESPVAPLALEPVDGHSPPNKSRRTFQDLLQSPQTASDESNDATSTKLVESAGDPFLPFELNLSAAVAQPIHIVEDQTSVNSNNPDPTEQAASQTGEDLSLNAVQPVFLSLAEARARMKGLPEAISSIAAAAAENVSADTSTTNSPRDRRERETSTNLSSPLIEAPSIGPKTAKRFEKIGIRTIGQFLEENPDELETRLQTRWLTASVIGQWQDQARLVCEVPLLSGYRAQLLVAVGCRTAWQLRTANANSLGTQLSHFCQTSEGQQILHSAQPPTVSDVAAWIESARNHARRKAA